MEYIKKWKLNILTLLVLSITFIACTRHKDLTFEDWDYDNDALINYSEFERTFGKNYYNDWNQNDDPYLDDEDFLVSTFNIWDVDEDNQLTEEEWIIGFDYYFGNYVISAYDVVDENDDDLISYEEYYNVLNDTEFYRDWDLNEDNIIHEEELTAGVFERWDLENDGVLDVDEYAAFDSYYIDF